jgi:oligoendopeptidase F
VTVTQTAYESGPWSLADLFPSVEAPEIETAVAKLKEAITHFESARPRLAADMDNEEFRDLLESYEQMTRQIIRLLGFAHLAFAENTQNQQAQTLMARMQQLAAESDNRTMFFKLWWKELPDAAAERLLPHSGDNRYWLEALRLQRPHTLSEAEERIINLKNVNGTQALLTLYQSITNRYAFKLEVDGEPREMTRAELQVFFRHPQPEVRMAAYQELYRVYGHDEPILGQIYQSVARDWRSEYVDLRRFATPISVRNLDNDIPDPVVETLLDVCRQNAPLFHRYFRLKKELLGLDQMRRYDLYAPLAQTETEYAFTDAVQLVMESLEQFDPKTARLARRVFEEQHLDSAIRKGKRGGAFCATIEPGLTPWLLQSYQGRLNDLTTMAHELGHAIHSMLAEHHTALTHHPSLPLAETASTFSEMLLVDHLLAQNPDPAFQLDLLLQQMDDAYATIIRQAYFALFERDAHKLIHEGAAIGDLSSLYLDQLRHQFGDSMDVSDDFRHEWVAIPHFYLSPFYVYAYSFGQLLVLSLYRQYRQEGAAFTPRYLEILSAGGSDSPTRILQRAGIDMAQPEFWQGGFDVVASMLSKLENLKPSGS